ncbi:MAG TPA: hypothetical protein VNH11_29550 [Pirellulales bacterium]|nr:hypothetical protein [Pirellulales bacterium]
MSNSNDTPGQPSPGRPGDSDKPESSGNREHVITAKDAGWRSPGFFVAPAKFVTLDPPEPKNRRKSSDGE